MANTEKILIMALEMEKRARDYYLNELDQVEGPRVMAPVRSHSEWEQEHADLIERHLRGEKGGPLPDEKAHSLEEIAREEQGERDPARVAVELTTLRTAMNMEMDAKNFYLRAADRSEEREEADFFRWLAGWEDQHWTMLDRSYRDLSEEYWGDMGFWPF